MGVFFNFFFLMHVETERNVNRDRKREYLCNWLVRREEIFDLKAESMEQRWWGRMRPTLWF